MPTALLITRPHKMFYHRLFTYRCCLLLLLVHSGGRCGGGGGVEVAVVVLMLVRPVPAHPPPPVVAALEHVGRGHRVQRPVAALTAAHVVVHARSASGHLDETVVQAQVVPDRVLPALSVAPVVRKLFRDVIVYLAQRHPLIGRGRDGHRDQRYVRVRRLLVTP